MTFNPFEKPLDDLAAIDLQRLIDRDVAEGLYMEYKREFPKNEKIGWSLASFANSYGGWYVVGVEADKQRNTAVKLTGIDLTSERDPISKVREIAKSHINPFPALKAKLVLLSAERGVLVVEIPDGQDKPFVSLNGRIYRRTADSSEPVYENDRYTIDRLYRKGRGFRKAFRERLAERLDLSPQDHRGWARILISPYPNIVTKLEVPSSEHVEETLKLSSDVRDIRYYSDLNFKGTIPFNIGFTTGTSIVLRQATDQPLQFLTLSAEFFIDGTAVFDIPVPSTTITLERESFE